MPDFQKIFSVKNKEVHKILTILGIKFYFKREKIYIEKTKKSIPIQDKYDLNPIINAKKMIIFLVPGHIKMNGGIMSIFSLCKTSKKLVPQAFSCISTYPGPATYAVNDTFNNDELVYRFEQIVKNAKHLEEIILHLPEYYSSQFCKNLSKKEVEFLKSIPKLQINIMNQNMELMPEPEEINSLYEFTSNITMTAAHKQSATQEICNKWGMPTHLFSVNVNCSGYKSYSFYEKEKIIALSPDKNVYKEAVRSKLQEEFPDWELIEIKNLSFSEYMDLIARAYFTVTFGEGMDGYFVQPVYVDSVGFTVYHRSFFPNSSWLQFNNVYSSYDDMTENICSDMKELLQNEEKYNEISSQIKARHLKLYNSEEFEDNLRRFYEQHYDFYPQKENLTAKR